MLVEVHRRHIQPSLLIDHFRSAPADAIRYTCPRLQVLHYAETGLV